MTRFAFAKVVSYTLEQPPSLPGWVPVGGTEVFVLTHKGLGDLDVHHMS